LTTGDLDHNDTLEPLLFALRRRRGIILVCVLLGLAASITLSQLQQSEYTASASILFRDPGIDQELFGFSVSLPSNDQASQAATNMALVSLPIVASRTAAALHMSRSAVSSAISVSGVGQANIAQINATEPDPVLAARIANTYAQQYVLFRQEADRAKISGAQELVQKQLQALPPAERYGTVGRGLQTRANELIELAALQTGNAEVVQPADVPTSPSAPNTKRNAVVGTFVGLLLGLGLAFLAERFDRRICDSSELEDAFGVALLGAVPFSRARELRIRARPTAAVATARVELRSGASAEAFGLLRARLRYFNVDRDVRVVAETLAPDDRVVDDAGGRSLLITSALPYEGKTTIAVNLAIAEAVAGGTKTVLVEADLRRPRFGHRLKLGSGPGLTEILTRNANLDAAVRRVHVHGTGSNNGSTAGFSVITAGGLPPNPVELLEGRAMVDLLSVLSEQFDLVILDTPSPSVVPDAIALMRLVTGVVIVARKNVITRDAARQLSGQLNKLQAPTLGVVANEMSARSRGHREHAFAAQPLDYAAQPLEAALPYGSLKFRRPSRSHEPSERLPD
jgi:succinoglycan biosynthesis transport protein ExoP